MSLSGLTKLLRRFVMICLRGVSKFSKQEGPVNTTDKNHSIYYFILLFLPFSSSYILINYLFL